MKQCGRCRRTKEKRGEEEALKLLSVNGLTCSPLGFLWRLDGSFIAMQSDENSNAEKKVYVSDRVEGRKSDRWLTQQQGRDEG